MVLSKDKSGPLIHFSISISLHLSAVRDEKSRGQAWTQQPFIFVCQLCCASTPFIYPRSCSPRFHSSLWLFFPPDSQTCPFLCLPHSLGLNIIIIGNCMETVPERRKERPPPLAGVHSTLTADWPQASAWSSISCVEEYVGHCVAM